MELWAPIWPAKVDFDSCSELPPLADEIVIWRDESGPFTISRINDSPDPRFRLRLKNASAIDVLADRRFIVHAGANAPNNTHEHFLADQAVPRAMSHEGSFVLHAGAVRFGQDAILIMGQSGRGKSTLASSFDHAGFALMGDDAMIISSLDATPRVRPVYPSLRLLPDSIDALMPGAATTEPMAHYSSKQRIDVMVAHETSDWPLPIVAIYSIAEPVEGDRIALRRMTLAETCMSLVTNSFALDPSDTTRARDRMEQASDLARHVPAFEISYPRDYARLPEVRQAILDQVAALAPA